MSMWFEYPIRKSFQLNIDSLYDFDLFYPILVIAKFVIPLHPGEREIKNQLLRTPVPDSGNKTNCDT